MFAILFGLMLFSVVGCGDNTVTDNSPGEASASFKINWHNSPAQSDNLSALNLDCAAEGVVTILCEIYDADGTWLASGGPWPCADGGGKITRIPPGPRRTFVIFGLDENNRIVYQGQSAEIDLEPGDHNDAGTIEAFPFRPILLAPADQAQLPPGPVSLTWQPVNSASTYRVLVATDSDFTDAAVIVDASTAQTAYTSDEYPSGPDYYWRVHAIDRYGNESGPSDPLRLFRTQAPPDTEPPTVAFSDPTGQIQTGIDTIDIRGTASDNVGVTQVSWANDRGGSGICTGTTAWSASGILLYSGTNVITVTASDAAGNTSSDTLTVIYTIPDLEPPTVAFTDPSGQVNTTINTITVFGTASDNVGVTQVSWTNDRGGSGVFTGTTTWSGSIPLFEGTNVITATARDAAGNTATDTLTVVYDSEPPVVTFTDPEGLVYTSVSGTATDNIGVTQVSWTNDRGGSGIFTGTTQWSGSIQLFEGTNVITATARDAAGNTATDTLTMDYSPSWQKRSPGAGGAYSVQVTPDGGYIVAGESAGYPYNAFLLKVDSQGTLDWYDTYLPELYYNSSARSVKVTVEGDYLFAGDATKWADETSVAYVVKTDPDGIPLEEKAYERDEADDAAYNIQLAENGGYIAVGSAGSRGYILKIDSELLLQSEWPKLIDEEEGITFKAIQVVSDGYVIVGMRYVEGGYRSYLIKTDHNGNERWQLTFGNTSWEESANAVVISPDEDYYIVAGSTFNGEVEEVNAYLIKIEVSSGTICTEDPPVYCYDGEWGTVDSEWGGTYGGENRAVANALQPHNGGYIIAGTIIYPYESPYEWVSDVYLLKIKGVDGTFDWEKTFGGETTSDLGYSLQVTPDNGFIIAGSSRPVGSGEPPDVYLIKTDATGE